MLVLINWSEITNDGVKGIIDVHQRDGGGTKLLQTEVPRSNAIHTFFVYRVISDSK